MGVRPSVGPTNAAGGAAKRANVRSGVRFGEAGGPAPKIKWGRAAYFPSLVRCIDACARRAYGAVAGDRRQTPAAERPVAQRPALVSSAAGSTLETMRGASPLCLFQVGIKLTFDYYAAAASS